MAGKQAACGQLIETASAAVYVLHAKRLLACIDLLLPNLAGAL
jgi:hypothetical protein